MILRQGAGSLSRWREPVRHPGLGLPDAEAAPDPGGGDLRCEGEPRCYSQPRIPATAHQTSQPALWHTLNHICSISGQLSRFSNSNSC